MKSIEIKMDFSKFILLSILPQVSVLLIGLIFVAINPSFDKYGLIQTGLVMPLSFIIIPYKFLKSYDRSITLSDIGIRKFKNRDIVIFLALIIIITSAIYRIKGYAFKVLILAIQMLIVSISEEIWARGMLIYELRNNNISPIISIILSSLIFAFVTHSNRPFFENLTYRLPFAIIMGFVYYKTKKIEYPILIHFLNNMIGGV